MRINQEKINFIYNSINRDVTQSNLKFWKNIVDKSKNDYTDIFIKIEEKAKNENNLDIIKFIKEILYK